MLKTAKTTRKEFMERVLEIMPWHITANNIRPLPMWCDNQVGEHSGAGFTSQNLDDAICQFNLCAAAALRGL